MRLTCYPLKSHIPEIVPAPLERAWMNETPERYAYRCLPLAIANGHGWEILNSHGFTVRWDGGAGQDALTIVRDHVDSPQGSSQEGAQEGATPTSHFGSGVLTFELGMLFRTEPGWNLFLSGPLNRPKRGIQGLTGVVEADWSPYPFTMNWQLTEANLPVRFEKDEPIAHLFPVLRGYLEAIEPEHGILADAEADLQNAYRSWRTGRGQFLDNIGARDPDAVKQRWQKHYFKGIMPSGEPGVPSGSPQHQTKLRTQTFVQAANDR